MKNYEELVRKIEDLKDTEDEVESLVPVKATVKQNADSIYSLRFTREEMTRLRSAAAKRGVKLSELIREGALDAAAAAEEKPTHRDTAIQKARDLVSAAAKALEKI